MSSVHDSHIKKFFPQRDPWVHKGYGGKVLVVAGSTMHTGSPIFNAVSALRTGADIVTVVGPRRAMDVVAAFAPDLITYPLDGELAVAQVPEIVALSKDFDALVIGCGVARRTESHQAVVDLVRALDMPMVIDAEGIRAVAAATEILQGKRFILTPHADEFRVLTGESVEPTVEDRRTKVRLWAQSLGVTILLKGAIDVISDGVDTRTNETGSPYMTKGGFGDTLAGICGTLLARHATPMEAGYAAAYINGSASERVCRAYGEGVVASDIFAYIPDVIARL